LPPTRCAMSTQRHCGGHHIDWMMACGMAMAPFTLARPVLCQYCHGAPGMVTTFAGAPFSTPAFEALLLRGGELTWKAGPVVNGSNLCHGSGGNGYAFLKLHKRTFLKLHKRTRDPVWLERARAFAMAAIDQVRGGRSAFGWGRYSLWTGNVGIAVYLWHCISDEPQFRSLMCWRSEKSPPEGSGSDQSNLLFLSRR
jgi:hypothetical protein